MYREVLHDVKVSQGTLRAKSRVFVDVSSANTSVRDSTFSFPESLILIFRIQSHVFTDPKEVNPSRGFDKYLVIDGAGSCVGLDLSSKVIFPLICSTAKHSTQPAPDDRPDGPCCLQLQRCRPRAWSIRHAQAVRYGFSFYV